MTGVLLDIGGCVVQGIGGEAIPGAPETVRRLRRDHPLRFVTNTTSRTRAFLAGTLRDAGFELDDADVVTPAVLARAVLTARDEARGILLAEETAGPDLAWYTQTPPAEARSVLLASEAHDRTIEDLQAAMLALRRGARLYTLQENRVYQKGDRIVTDLGPVAAFLAYAADTEWENLGKPAPLLFRTIANELGCEPRDLVMVGDDAEFDVAGALRSGVGRGVLVRTGKYRAGDEARFEPSPSAVIDSVTALAGVLDTP